MENNMFGLAFTRGEAPHFPNFEQPWVPQYEYPAPPEGGLSDSEARASRSNGFASLALGAQGPTAMAALSAINSIIGTIGERKSPLGDSFLENFFLPERPHQEYEYDELEEQDRAFVDEPHNHVAKCLQCLIDLENGTDNRLSCDICRYSEAAADTHGVASREVLEDEDGEFDFDILKEIDHRESQEQMITSENSPSNPEEDSLGEDVLGFLREYKASRQSTSIPSLREGFMPARPIGGNNESYNADNRTSQNGFWKNTAWSQTNAAYSSINPSAFSLPGPTEFARLGQNSSVAQAKRLFGDPTDETSRSQSKLKIPPDKKENQTESKYESGLGGAGELQGLLTDIRAQSALLATSGGTLQAKDAATFDPKSYQPDFSPTQRNKIEYPLAATRGEECTVAALLRTVTEAFHKLRRKSRKGSRALQKFVDDLESISRIIKIGFGSLSKILKGQMPVELEEIYCYLHVAYAMYRVEQSDEDEKKVASQLYKDLEVFEAVLSSQSPPDTTSGSSPRDVFLEIVNIMWKEIKGAIQWIGKNNLQLSLGGFSSELESAAGPPPYAIQNLVHELSEGPIPSELVEKQYQKGGVDDGIQKAASVVSAFHIHGETPDSSQNQRGYNPDPFKVFPTTNSPDPSSILYWQPSLANNPPWWYQPELSSQDKISWALTPHHSEVYDAWYRRACPQKAVPTAKELLQCNITQSVLKYLNRLSLTEMLILFMAGMISSLLVWAAAYGPPLKKTDCDLCGEPLGALHCRTCEEALVNAKAQNLKYFKSFWLLVSKYTALFRDPFHAGTQTACMADATFTEVIIGLDVAYKPITDPNLLDEAFWPHKLSHFGVDPLAECEFLTFSPQIIGESLQGAQTVSVALPAETIAGEPAVAAGSRKRKRGPSPQRLDVKRGRTNETREKDMGEPQNVSVGQCKATQKVSGSSSCASSLRDSTSTSFRRSSKRIRKHKVDRRPRNPDTAKIPCESCPQLFSNKDSLRKHRQDQHDATSTFTVYCNFPQCLSKNSGGTERRVRSNMNTHQNGRHLDWIKGKTLEERFSIIETPL